MRAGKIWYKYLVKKFFIFILCVIAIIAGKYAYNVLSDVDVTKWDINGNEIYSYGGKGCNKNYHYYDEKNRCIEYKSVMKSLVYSDFSVYYDYEGDVLTKIRYVYKETPEKDHETVIVKVNDKCEQYVDSLEGTTTYEYDSNGNMIRITRPNGNSTSYVYNEQGKKILEEDSDGSVTEYEYDSLGRCVKILGNTYLEEIEYKQTPSGKVEKWKTATAGKYDISTTFIIDENDVLIEGRFGDFATRYKKLTKCKYWKNGNLKSKKVYTLASYHKKISDSE